MMQHRKNIILWLMAFWMLCSIPSVHAVSQASQPSAWQTTVTLSQDNYPSYEFYSTSSIAPVVGSTSYHSGPCYAPGAGHGGIRRDSWNDPGEDDDPVGVLPETPVGEPLILLLFALLFIVYKRRIAS
ncbi:MAG: hypothetical protein IJ554_04455 [Paludibacteraceae bacterium]|nr:hypothetical protein [Paludibacteraceae bacterium]